MGNLLATDGQYACEAAAITAASAALGVSGVPWPEPVAAVQVSTYRDASGAWAHTVGAPAGTRRGAILDMIVAGTARGIVCLEAAGKQVPVDAFVGAVQAGWDALPPLLEAQHELVRVHGKPKEAVRVASLFESARLTADTLLRPMLLQLFSEHIHSKASRAEKLHSIQDMALASLQIQYPHLQDDLSMAIDTITRLLMN